MENKEYNKVGLGLPVLFGNPIMVNEQRIIIPLNIVGTKGTLELTNYDNTTWVTSAISMNGSGYLTFEIMEEGKWFEVNINQIKEQTLVKVINNIFNDEEPTNPIQNKEIVKIGDTIKDSEYTSEQGWVIYFKDYLLDSDSKSDS